MCFEISWTFLTPCSCSESLYEDEEFDQRQLAALVASKVTFLFSNQFVPCHVGDSLLWQDLIFLSAVLSNFCLFPQVFYHLGEHNDSLSYALGAGPLFDVSEDTDYVHTVLGINFISYCYCSDLINTKNHVVLMNLYLPNFLSQLSYIAFDLHLSTLLPQDLSFCNCYCR